MVEAILEPLSVSSFLMIHVVSLKKITFEIFYNVTKQLIVASIEGFKTKQYKSIKYTLNIH